MAFDLFDRAFELADICLDILCNVVGYVIGQFNAHFDRFIADNGDSGLKIRRLNISQQTPFKTGLHAVLERVDFLRRTVRSEHDLLFLPHKAR